MTPGRKLTPVQVIYFPKKGRRLAGRVTQTIPEIAGPIDEPVTEVDVEAPVEARPRGKKRRSRAGPHGGARITLSDEHPEDVAAGFSDLAALGHELFTSGRVQEARAIYEGLIVSRPDDAFAHTMLGTIYLALEELDRALELFEVALRCDPNDLAALVYRGEIRMTKKKGHKAIEDFERALRLGAADDPFTERAHRLLKMARRARR